MNIIRVRFARVFMGVGVATINFNNGILFEQAVKEDGETVLYTTFFTWN